MSCTSSVMMALQVAVPAVVGLAGMMIGWLLARADNRSRRERHRDTDQ